AAQRTQPRQAGSKPGHSVSTVARSLWLGHGRRWGRLYRRNVHRVSAAVVEPRHTTNHGRGRISPASAAGGIRVADIRWTEVNVVRSHRRVARGPGTKSL